MNVPPGNGRWTRLSAITSVAALVVSVSALVAVLVRCEVGRIIWPTLVGLFKW